MKTRTYYISDGVCFRNRKMHKEALTRADKRYLHKTTNYKDKTWEFFSTWEEDFRLLHMPFFS
jgi:hypothetical protein